MQRNLTEPRTEPWPAWLVLGIAFLAFCSAGIFILAWGAAHAILTALTEAAK